MVGERLKRLGEAHQVICVTHLPQIACFGERHFLVQKKSSGGRTITLLEELKDETKRESEIARMLGGKEITPSTLKHAREMLSSARMKR
jgi:DNA repair protein RecN (Recombination protein N)